MAKKDPKDAKGKGGKKGKKEEPPAPEEEVLVAATDLEPEPEDVQFTDTSYTSASFESLPIIVEEVKPKKPKKKGKGAKEVESEIKHEEEVFQWSEDSLPVEEEQKPVEEQKEEPKKVAKKGKGKKKEKEKEEEIPVFEKPKKWKTMQKKERDAWLAQMIEEWRAEMEAEKQRKLAGAKEKRLTEARKRAEQMAKDQAEQEIRRDLLAKTCVLFGRFEKDQLKYQNQKQAVAEWQQYLRCDGQPDPRVVTQISTYLHVWRNTPDCGDNELARRCTEALPIIELLEEIVANSRQYTERQARNYNEVRLGMRAQLASAIQCASFSILRNLEKNLKYLSIRVAMYNREFAGLKLNVWVAVRMPTMKAKPHEPPREPVDLEFPALKVAVRLPPSVDSTCVGVRAARSMDLLSEATRSFAIKEEIRNRYQDLFVFNVKEHVELIKVKANFDSIRSQFYKEVGAKIKELENFLKANIYANTDAEKEELDNLNMLEPPPLPDPRDHIGEQNGNSSSSPGIVGGVLNLDLLIIPPQPKRVRGKSELTTLQLPKELQSVKYQVQYRAPGPPPEGVVRTPEEIEAEMKKTEEAYEKLALVFIELPQDTIWTEPPVVCQWQEARKLWTNNYINDYKFNEDKFTIQFRTGVLWPIGIAALRYNNMPYQGWEMKPDPNSKGVLLIVTGVCVTVTFLCVRNAVELKFVSNSPTRALKEHFNKKYSVKRLLQIMREAACDLFPDFDGHNYVEGSCPKEWVSERHNYHAMAFLSRAYNFQWSRWNATAGSRNIIMQFREAVDKKRQAKLNLLYVTPQRATVLKCNEQSQELTMDPMMGLSFYPDLFTLNLSYGSVDARRTVFDVKFSLAETVFSLLQELKLSSYS